MTTVKFVASIAEVNKDTDVLVEDVQSMGAKGIVYFVDEALNRNDDAEVFVVGDDLTMAENVALVLNQKYNEELELMNNAQIAKETVVKAMEEAAKPEMEKAAVIAQSTAAQKFLAKHGAALANANKGPVAPATETKNEEEVVMNNTVAGKKTMGGRRRLNSGVAVSQEVKEVQNQEEVIEVKETKKAPRRRMSTGNTEAPKVKNTTGRKKLGRGASMKSEFVKFDGPWYLNKSLYPVLDRFEEIIETMSDAELGLDQIVLVDPEEISRYRNRTDISVVIQLKANGNVLEFPIKEATGTNSSSDLNSTSIGWIQTKNGMRPAFGFWRPNALQVEVTCGCGNKFKANTGNVYCPKCRTRHDDIVVSADSNLEFDFDGEWTFQTVPNLVVPRDVLALVMAIAQYDAGFDMWDVVADDAE